MPSMGVSNRSVPSTGNPALTCRHESRRFSNAPTPNSRPSPGPCVDDAAIDVDHGGDLMLRGEGVAHALAAGERQPARHGGITKDTDESGGHGVGLPFGHQYAVDAIPDDLGNAAAVDRHHRFAA